MESKHLAMASVPVQQWNGQLYDADQALKVGTIFPELNKPFFAAESLPGAEVPIASQNFRAPGQEEREKLMSQISSISFVLDDLVLFIDTHPEQQEALTMRTQLIQQRKQLLQEYDQKYYPLTKDCQGPWTQGPMPWEGACI